MNAMNTIARAHRAAHVRVARNVKVHALPTQLRAPIVSFTFDDFPRSALSAGGRMLEARGWAGTYFAAGGLCGRTVDGMDYFTPDDLLRAHEAGHEIGCHTFDHLRLRGAPAPAVREDLDRNAAFIEQHLPSVRLSSFAYPYGDLDLGKKALAAHRFPICRGIWPGLNHGMVDFGQLKAVGLEQGALDGLDVDALLDQAALAKGWLIFFTHDVSDAPSPFGCHTSSFEAVLDKVAARGLRVLPLKNAAGAARFSG